MAEQRQEFQRDLDLIEAQVVRLFGLVSGDLPGATYALVSGRDEALAVLADHERAIDTVYREIENLASQEILLQAPVASDLRFLVSVLRIAPELERSHDLVMQIASRANRDLSQELSPRSRGLVERMGDLAADMWRQAADSWRLRDRSAGPVLSEQDGAMGRLHSDLIAELASGRIALPVAMQMTLVAHFYRRLGGHAVNVTRRVAYLAGSASR